MQERRVFITDTDRDRLEKLLLGARQWSNRDKAHLQALEEELDKAHTVESKDIPGDVVTMRSQVRVKDMKAGTTMDISVVFPSEADSEQGKISVLAPIGTALLGYRVGDILEWKVPGGLRRLKIECILYQPEAAGDYHLWPIAVGPVCQRWLDGMERAVLFSERGYLRKANVRRTTCGAFRRSCSHTSGHTTSGVRAAARHSA